MGMMLKYLVHPYIQSTTVLCDHVTLYAKPDIYYYYAWKNGFQFFDAYELTFCIMVESLKLIGCLVLQLQQAFSINSWKTRILCGQLPNVTFLNLHMAVKLSRLYKTVKSMSAFSKRISTIFCCLVTS